MEDIPYDLQTMAKIVGFENFLEICRMYGGTYVYIPVYKKVIMGRGIGNWLRLIMGGVWMS